jgi:hypothetical protein
MVTEITRHVACSSTCRESMREILKTLSIQWLY